MPTWRLDLYLMSNLSFAAAMDKYSVSSSIWFGLRSAKESKPKKVGVDRGYHFNMLHFDAEKKTFVGWERASFKRKIRLKPVLL